MLIVMTDSKRVKAVTNNEREHSLVATPHCFLFILHPQHHTTISRTKVCALKHMHTNQTRCLKVPFYMHIRVP